jgi:hypothetical protein
LCVLRQVAYFPLLNCQSVARPSSNMTNFRVEQLPDANVSRHQLWLTFPSSSEAVTENSVSNRTNPTQQTYGISQTLRLTPYRSALKGRGHMTYKMQAAFKLTPCSRVLPERLPGPQLIKKFPALYGTQRFINTFKTACHLSLP